MSPKHWFFISYARVDADEYLKKFVKELVKCVRLQVGGSAEEVGFFDTEDIALGQEWPAALSAALQGARVMLPIYTPSYFLSENCGREWQIFEDRRCAAVAGQSAGQPAGQSGALRPPVILPVLWVAQDRLPSPLPAVATEIQYTHEQLGAEYAGEGMWQLMRLSKFRDARREVIDRLAATIISVAKEHPLPELPSPPALRSVTSAFLGRPASPPAGGAATPAAASAPTSTGAAGPRYVQFIFVAGRRSELQGVRSRLDGYGNEGGIDWQPYLPDYSEEVYVFAQSVAATEKLRYESVPLGPDLIQRLEAAERDDKIVVLLVDTWTLRLEQYHRFMREYDRRSFLNCVVAVPWNPRDEETVGSRDLLEKALQITFSNRLATSDPESFQSGIASPDELRQKLSAALNAARMRLLNVAKVRKLAESQRVIARPLL